MEESKKTNGKRNRSAGHGFEKTIAQRLRDMGFPHVVTCRSESRSRDNEGIDLINKNEAVNGRLPYNISCKNYSQPVKYSKLLAAMPQQTGAANVVLHKLTKRTGTVFRVVGTYAIMDMENFMKMIERIRKLEELVSFTASESISNDGPY